MDADRHKTQSGGMNGIDCVLGAGPSAVAATHELLKAGRKVLMIDPGRRLPQERQTLIDDFRRNPDPEALLTRLRALARTLPKEFRGKKLPFASPHVYDGVDRFLPIETKNAVVTRSLATGGLSAVWGATVMPFAEESFRNWPVTLADMGPYYRSAAELMDVPHVDDDLTPIYPNFGKGAPATLSEQATHLMSNLLNARAQLRNDGIVFGRCRSAIRQIYAANDGEGCVNCGLCMYGCPHNAIFNAEHVVDGFEHSPSFERKAGWIAEGFEETSTGVKVRIRNIDTNHSETVLADRLFVGCGAVTSLRLVAGAMEWFDRPFDLMDTQLVIIPLILTERCRTGALPKANALGQIFVEMKDAAICDEYIHLQVYGYNPFIADGLRARWGAIVQESLLRPLFDQMMIVMGYLPGQISGRISMIVKPSPDGGIAGASYAGKLNPRTRPAVKRIGQKLMAHRKSLGAIPLMPLAEIPEPGASIHLAGGIPMHVNPDLYESDDLGRPGGLRRVHMIDSACFPDLPAEHLTYTIMANAMRIAAQSTRNFSERQAA